MNERHRDVRRIRGDGGAAAVAAAGLAVLAALLVTVAAQGPLVPVERAFVGLGVALLALGTTLGVRLVSRPRPRLMDGRFVGDEDAARAAPEPPAPSRRAAR